LKYATCGLSSLVLDIDGGVQENVSCTVCPLTHHKCNIHCESSCMGNGSSKCRWAL